MVKALEENYESAPISRQDRVMLDYVVQVTKDATRISPADHDRLREVGFNDQGILQITLIASWFNYINRVADALGVGREAAQPVQCEQPSTTEPRSGSDRVKVE
jgi:alkylhydroperoxidase family enzyme